MKFTVDVSDALNLEIKAAAAAAGITRAEWVRVALAAAAHPDPIPPHPGSTPADGPAAGADRLTLLPRRRWRGRAGCARAARWKLTYVRTKINDVRRCRQPARDEK